MKNIRVALFLSIIINVCVYAQGTMILEIDPSAADPFAAAIAKVADEAYQLNLRGLDALEGGDLNAAMELFNQAVRVFPQYSDAHNNRGAVMYRRGDVEGARRVWEENILRDPQYHVSYYNMGLLLLHSGKPDEAIRQFEIALRHNRGFYEAMLRIGAAHLRAGRARAAVEQFANAYKIAPAKQDVWSFYSFGLLAAGDTAKAVDILRNAGDNVDALTQLGRIEGIRKRYDQAIGYLSRAVDRGAPTAVAIDLASIQIDAGKCRDALATMTRLLAKETRPPVDAWLLAGFAAKECDGPQKALEYYERGLRQYPRDQMLLGNAGQIYFIQNNHAKAEEMWSGISDAQLDPQTLYRRAIAARLRNDIGAAERHIRRAIAMDEKAEYYDFLGVITSAKGDDRAAEEHFKRALRIDPNLMSAQLNLAVKSRSPADLEKAVADAARRLSSCGNNCADAALQLSVLYYHRKDIERALFTLESVRDANRDARIYRHIAVYNRELRRHDRAVAALEAATARFGNDAKLKYELAEAYLDAGMPAKAASAFLSLLPNWKENVWRLHYQLGYAYKDMNDLTNAKASFERSLAAKRDNPAARALLAFVLNRMGDTETAVGHWEQTAREDGNNAAIHINLGLSYEGRGQYDRALESYRKAQSIDPNDKAININIGNAYKGLLRFNEAFEAYNRGLESNKRDIAAYNIFFLARQRGDDARAERMYELFRRELRSSPQFAEVSAEWESAKKVIAAKQAFDRGDFRGAYRMYAEIAGGAGANADVQAYIHNMILAAHNANMHREATDAADRFASRISNEKDRAEIYRIAANSAVALKDWARAKQLFSRLTAFEPNSAVYQYNLAVAHYNLGEVEQAYGRYQRARELDRTISNKDIETRYEQFKRGGTPPRDVGAGGTPSHGGGLDSLDMWYNDAVDLQNSNKLNEAEALYRKILAQNPTYSLAWNNLGAIFGARGDLEDAVSAYLKALENQNAVETFANLANVYIALEEFAKARDIIAKGLSHHPRNAALTRLERQVKNR